MGAEHFQLVQPVVLAVVLATKHPQSVQHAVPQVPVLAVKHPQLVQPVVLAAKHPQPVQPWVPVPAEHQLPGDPADQNVAQECVEEQLKVEEGSKVAGGAVKMAARVDGELKATEQRIETAMQEQEKARAREVADLRLKLGGAWGARREVPTAAAMSMRAASMSLSVLIGLVDCWSSR